MLYFEYVKSTPRVREGEIPMAKLFKDRVTVEAELKDHSRAMNMTLKHTMKMLMTSLVPSEEINISQVASGDQVLVQCPRAVKEEMIACLSALEVIQKKLHPSEAGVIDSVDVEQTDDADGSDDTTEQESTDVGLQVSEPASVA